MNPGIHPYRHRQPTRGAYLSTGRTKKKLPNPTRARWSANHIVASSAATKRFQHRFNLHHCPTLSTMSVPKATILSMPFVKQGLITLDEIHLDIKPFDAVELSSSQLKDASVKFKFSSSYADVKLMLC